MASLPVKPPATAPREPSCGACKYFVTEAGLYTYGLCHLEPQMVNKHKDEWCSHFARPAQIREPKRG
jgi:hypothetical protein